MITCLFINQKNVVLRNIDENNLYYQFPGMVMNRKSMVFPTELGRGLVVYSEEGDFDGYYKNTICNKLAGEDDYYYGMCIIVREDKNGNVKSLTKRDVAKLMKRCYEAIL